MIQENNVPEIKNNGFYFKKVQENLPCAFAYLHLAEKTDETFVAFFENLEAREPMVYWWNENDADVRNTSRQTIIEFVGEAYLSVYVASTLVKPIDKPLWTNARLENSIIPADWWRIVESINRENYGSQKK